jgi:hypothetical protein
MLTQIMRDAAHSVYFSDAWLEDEILTVPYPGGRVRFDLRARTVTGPSLKGPEITLSLDSLDEFVLDHYEMMGDTKTHHFFTVYLARGEFAMAFQERAKEYFEYHPEVSAEYERTCKRILALPALLGLIAASEKELISGDVRPIYLRRSLKKESSSVAGLGGLALAGLGLVAFLLLRRR